MFSRGATLWLSCRRAAAIHLLPGPSASSRAVIAAEQEMGGSTAVRCYRSCGKAGRSWKGENGVIRVQSGPATDPGIS
jgi:hypothetical protein